MISLNLNVSKIDKNKLVKGEKGVYLNAVLIETPNSEFSDYMIVQDTTKEERDAGVKGTILGNAKIVQKKAEPVSEQEKDDMPF